MVSLKTTPILLRILSWPVFSEYVPYNYTQANFALLGKQLGRYQALLCLMAHRHTRGVIALSLISADSETP